MSSLSSFEGSQCRVCDTGPLQSSNCLLPCLFCCLGRLLNIQLCHGFVLVIESVNAGGKGCFDNRGKASFQVVLRQKASSDCILDRCMDARLGCYECSQVRRSCGGLSRLFWGAEKSMSS